MYYCWAYLPLSAAASPDTSRYFYDKGVQESSFYYSLSRASGAVVVSCVCGKVASGLLLWPQRTQRAQQFRGIRKMNARNYRIGRYHGLSRTHSH